MLSFRGTAGDEKSRFALEKILSEIPRCALSNVLRNASLNQVFTDTLSSAFRQTSHRRPLAGNRSRDCEPNARITLFNAPDYFFDRCRLGMVVVWGQAIQVAVLSQVCS